MPKGYVYELPKASQDLTGHAFGRWTVLRFVVRKLYGKDSGHNCWMCRCSCGKSGDRVVSGPSLLSGQSLSCGCLCRERTSAANKTHGYTSGVERHPLCTTHRNMMNRCYCPRSNSYQDYGAKGIRVEPEWHNVANFIREMEPTWFGGFNEMGEPVTLDRIDSRSNYGPGLCKWSTKIEQANNQKSNVKITANGKTMNRAQWARELGITPQVLQTRQKLGWSDHDTINVPIGERRGRSGGRPKK